MKIAANGCIEPRLAILSEVTSVGSGTGSTQYEQHQSGRRPRSRRAGRLECGNHGRPNTEARLGADPRAGLWVKQIRAFSARQGHSPKVPFPRVLGIEAVGEVVSAPDGGFGEGDTVATAMGRKRHLSIIGPTAGKSRNSVIDAFFASVCSGPEASVRMISAKIRKVRNSVIDPSGLAAVATNVGFSGCIAA